VVTNPKSLSVVASQNPVVAAALDRVLSRQADEIARYLSAVAVTRVGGRGAQREVGGLTVETARVRHLTSREGDPHRHVHLMLNTRVRTAEGEWRGLHSVAVRQHIRAVHELGNRVILTDRNLREALAGEGYTLGADREIDQARGAVKLMSKRAVQVAANRERAEAAWREAHPGREPSQRVRNGWDQQGWAQGRKAKPFERETPEEMAERVRVELAEAGFEFTLGAHRSVEWEESSVSVGGVDRDRVAADVVSALSGMKSAWSNADLTAQVEVMVASTGVVGDPRAVGELVEDVRARAAGRCVSVLDPGEHTPTVMSRHLTSAQVLDADQRLNLGLAGLAGGVGGRDVDAARLAAGEGLDEGQAMAVAAVCGARRLEVIVGPAGTGKTRMLNLANRRLAAHGRDMVVFAPTRKAALVAGAEVGAEGAALSKLLYDHGFRWDPLGRWSRLEVGQADPATGRVHQGPTGRSVLSARSVVVVDEAGLMTVDQANALVDIAAESGAAVRLVGDPRQLGAVGRGGVMETASRWAERGPVMLDQVHRFLTVTLDDTGLPVTGTDVDYAALTLLLRDGDHPEVAVDRLVERGAVIVHASEREATAAIAEQVAAQGEAAITVTVATNDQAAALNQAVRQLRVAAGQVDDTQTAIGMDGTRIGAGDRIVTRRNDTGRNVANRETWTVETVTDTGTVIAQAVGGHERRVQLDADYLAAHTQLSYATTDYGNQGVTTDRAVTWVGEATTGGGLYVGATRGRYDNTVHLVADDIDDARVQLVAAAGRDRADRGLDVARARAEADAVSSVVAGPAPPAVGGRHVEAVGLRYEPEHWRTKAELDAAATAAHARLAALRPPTNRPVMADAVRERDNRTDRDAATAARQQAGWHRGEAARIHADRDRLAQQATVEFLAARDDARVIQAGPGRFGRKAGQVDAAQTRRAETARRWADPQLPGAQWTDETVRQSAQSAAERAVAPHVHRHLVEADRHDQVAVVLDRKIAARDRDQQTAIRANQAAVAEHDQQVAKVTAEVDRATQSQDLRAQLVEAMTPDEVAACDAARETWRTEQDRQALGKTRSAVSGVSRDPIQRAKQAAAAKQAREATLARQLGIHWDPDATGTAKARQTIQLQQAARARDLAQQRIQERSHGIEM
jgi:exodeoxyribonuclease V alpha subunit